MDIHHRGFDNLWYILEGSASTGHSTGPDGAIERARLPKGALLALRTGRGAWHAEGIGAEEREEGLGDTEWRSVLFWVNLARQGQADRPERAGAAARSDSSAPEGEAIIRTLVGDGSPVQLGTPLAGPGCRATHRWSPPRCRPGSRASPACWTQGGLRGEPARAEPSQLVLLGPGEEPR